MAAQSFGVGYVNVSLAKSPFRCLGCMQHPNQAEEATMIGLLAPMVTKLSSLGSGRQDDVNTQKHMHACDMLLKKNAMKLAGPAALMSFALMFVPHLVCASSRSQHC